MKQNKVIDHWDFDRSQLAPVKGGTSFSCHQNGASILAVGKFGDHSHGKQEKTIDFLMVRPPDAKTLEGIACSDVFQFLGHLWRCAVQFLRDTFLLMGVHRVKLLTKISIDHILEEYKQSQ